LKDLVFDKAISMLLWIITFNAVGRGRPPPQTPPLGASAPRFSAPTAPLCSALRRISRLRRWAFRFFFNYNSNPGCKAIITTNLKKNIQQRKSLDCHPLAMDTVPFSHQQLCRSHCALSRAIQHSDTANSFRWNCA